VSETVAKKLFWDRKILGWEAKRYHSTKNSVSFRLRAATDWLAPKIPGASVLDLGCGSGKFLAQLSSFSPAKLFGIDLSDRAIARARETLPATVDVRSGDALNLPFPPVDLITGLGFLDWLNSVELETLFTKLAGTPFFFSFSERRPTLQRALHFAFVMVSYGWRSRGYRPSYLSAEEIREVARRHGYATLYFHRHPRMSFGTFVSSFPLASTVVSRYFDDAALDYGPRSRRGVWKRVRAREAKAIQSVLPTVEGKAVLDAAAGSGYYTERLSLLAPGSLTAVDLSEKMLSLIHGPAIRRVAGDVRSLTFPELFDLILCAGGLEFMESPSDFFKRSAEISGEDAALVLFVPRRNLFGYLYRRFHRGHGIPIHLFDLPTLHSLAAAHGWRMVATKNVFSGTAVRFEK